MDPAAMIANSYRNVVPPWQVELVARRAKRMGFRHDELADLQQRIVPHLAAFQFDARRSNGAAPRTAVVAVIDQQLKAAARASERYRRHLERWRAAALHQRIAVTDEAVAMALDVRQAVATLPPRERLVCEALSNGATLADIAGQLGCNWHAVRRLVRNIRMRFEALGLQD